VKDLGNTCANRNEFERFISSKKPNFIFLNGHGNYSSVCGHKNEPILDSKNSNLTKGSIVYALSCKAGAKLSKNCVDNGAKSFIGYAENFGFVTDSSKECTPFEDEYANFFREAACTIPFSLLKGNNSFEAVEKTKNVYMKTIKNLSRSDSKEDFKHIRFWLFWNMMYLVNVGNGEATL
jgi:hypothetical protein